MTKIIITSILTILIFTGCISLTKELPAFKTYSLSYTKNPKNSLFINKTIQVLEPKALVSVNSRSISYSKNSFISDNYALSRWIDKPSKMIQQNIVSYLVDQNSYKFISTSNIKVDTDYKLVSELVDFKHTFTKNSSYADFSIRVYLINNKNNKIYFKSFTYNKKADSNNAQGLVNSINNIFNYFLSDLNTFVQSKI